MKMKFLETKILGLLLVTCMATLVACGDDNDSTSVIIQEPRTEERQEQGTFSTPPMVIVNNNIENNVKASSRVKVEGDTVIMRVECRGAPRNVIHKQYIHTGTRCPSIADDTNGDGVIDWMEAQQVAGPLLLSMDGNPESSEQSGFPRSGTYTYERRASLERILDILPSGEDFLLAGRVVIIYGVSSSTPLPATVATNGDEPAYVNVPISCAVINAQSQPTTGGTTDGGTTDDREEEEIR
jgi:hypothetical protein